MTPPQDALGKLKSWLRLQIFLLILNAVNACVGVQVATAGQEIYSHVLFFIWKMVAIFMVCRFKNELEFGTNMMMGAGDAPAAVAYDSKNSVQNQQSYQDQQQQ